jgi:hypothetical protein
MFGPELVTSTSVRGSQLELAVRLNWFRSIPLSCVVAFEVRVDGVLAQPERLRVAGHDYDVSRLQDHDDTWWDVMDDGLLVVRLEEGSRGDPHSVELVMRTRIPSLVDHTGSPVVVVDRSVTEVGR